VSKPTPKEMREILTDWYIAVGIQRETGNVSIRNGVELRMHEVARRIFDLRQRSQERGSK
jgi:hypothetical protein